MRDLHKVREQEGLLLSISQVYALLGLVALAMGLVFVLGFSLGRQAPAAVAQAADPLVPPDIQNDSVALLLARAAEEEAEASEHENVELQFHDILPARTGDEAEAPPPPPAGSGAGVVKQSAGSDRGKSPPEAPGDEDAIGDLVSVGNPDGGAEAKPRTGEPGVAPSTGTAEATNSGSRRIVAASSNPISSAPNSSDDQDRVQPAASARPDSRSGPGAEGRSAGKTEPDEKSLATDRSSGSDSGGKAVREKPAEGGTQTERAAKPARSESKENGAGGDSQERKGTGRQYTVQVSSYQEPNVADKLVRQLTAQGFSAYKVAAEVNGNTWYRVRVGAFDNRDGAEQEMQRLKAARSELNPMITHR